jgi:hypothetical protein
MVRRKVPGGVACYLRIWYRHSLRGKKNLTATPTGRAHQPSGASVIVTHRTWRPSITCTSVVSSMCSVSEGGVDVRAHLVAVLLAKI